VGFSVIGFGKLIVSAPSTFLLVKPFVSLFWMLANFLFGYSPIIFKSMQMEFISIIIFFLHCVSGAEMLISARIAMQIESNFSPNWFSHIARIPAQKPHLAARSLAVS